MRRRRTQPLARTLSPIGTVLSSAVGKAWKKILPTATHIIEYKQKETGTKHLAGKVATELSSINYGPAEWWLLLEPAPAVVGSS